MRLADIAKELRVTTQELRRELEKTNFGISGTAHEVDDNLGKGILRFLKGKVKPTLTHRRVAVIFKDGKEERVETVESTPVVAETPPAPSTAPVFMAPPDRSRVPKADQPVAAPGAPSFHVSRRIEVAPAQANADTSSLPKHYYKPKKRRKGRPNEEEKALEVLSRHPSSKAKVAKVSYNVGEAGEGGVAEDIAIERATDQERFRQQKKQRATSQKRGHKLQPQIKAKTGVIEIPAVLSVKEFAEKCGLPVPNVISTLMKNGIMATINQILDFETAAVVASDLGVEVRQAQAEATAEELFAGNLKMLLKEEDPANLVPRPPIISVMGHVDHGKTKLLDSIRNANVMATEAGGITQAIGAYQVVKNGKPITFLDTPGHEAFTAMRARGAKATDIAILVVAADEGVKPQTVEAIHHAQEAGIPIIVAINKIDRPGANPDKVKAELAEYNLHPEEWGGNTPMVPVSALKGEGIDTLLEMILLVAELENLKANPNRPAVGTVIESHLDPSLGPVATILVNTGTLRVGDNIVVGACVGRVKTMHDYLGQSLETITPSGAARISGLDRVPQAGDLLQVVKDEKTARQRMEQMKALRQEQEESLKGSLADRLATQISKGEMKFLKIVLKADSKGSLEAIMQALSKVKSDLAAIKIIHFSVGNVSDTDVLIAGPSQALLIAFNVEANMHVRRLAQQEHVDLKHYNVIYKLIEDLTGILSGMLEPEILIHELGTIRIKQIFLNKKTWIIAGAEVIKGKVQAGSILRFKRGEELVFETPLESLKHVREDVRELEQGSDCGVQFKTPKPVVVDDVLEVYKIEKIQRHLD